MTHPIDRKAITAEDVDRILDGLDGLSGINREELRADLEGIRSLYFTGLELRSKPYRQEVARTLEAATGLRSLISQEIVGKKPTAPFFFALDIRHQVFLRHLNSFIAELERDSSPTLIRQLDIYRGVSPFENVIRMLADRWRHYADEDPGYTITVDSFVDGKAQIGGEVRSGGFVDFAELALIAMGIYKDDGTRYSRRAISTALTKVKR
jgi:hypothetical protein